MSTYRKIHGRSIQAVTTDPTESVAEGQVWYNTTSDTFKSVVSAAAWSSTSKMVNALARSQGAGTTSAGLSMGGQDGSDTKLTVTEEYNGTGWSLGGSMPAAKSDHAGAGTQTAAFAAGGSPYLNSAYNYNGTSWSGIPNIGTARQKFAGCGTTTASLVFGAQVPGSPPQGGQTEEYNGSSWSEQNDLNTARAKLAGCGTQTAGLGFGGYQPTIPSPPKQKAQTEQYDGTSWSEVSDMITATSAGAGAGTQTAAIAYGGSAAPGNTTATQDWNGTAWTTSSATLGTALSNNGGAGTSTSALSIAGYAPSVTNNVEEYNVSANVITAAAWAAGPALGTGRYSGVSGGTTTAAIFAGGGYPRDKNETELYDGTSWSEVNNMNSGRGRLSGTGTPSSAVGAGGYTPNSYSSAAEQWNGTNWSNITSLPASRQYMGSIGASGSAALFIGGNSSGSAPSPAYQVNETLYWNGSSWATGGSYPNTVWNPRGFGTISAGISCGGNNGPTTSSNSYNGSSWTSGPSLNVARDNCGASGATDGDGLIYGGGSDLSSEKWDGTSFATSASFANTHNGGGSNQNGSSSTAMIFGNAPNGNAHEEFTAETTTLNVKTLTQS